MDSYNDFMMEHKNDKPIKEKDYCYLCNKMGEKNIMADKEDRSVDNKVQNSGTAPVTTSQLGDLPAPTQEQLKQVRINQDELAAKLLKGESIGNIRTDTLNIPFQEALANNIGEFVVIEFLIGTDIIEKKQGILFNVGVSFVTLFEEDTKTFVICDFYSIKFVTFYLPGQRPPKNNNMINNKRMSGR